jgi:hypothetical protein
MCASSAGYLISSSKSVYLDGGRLGNVFTCVPFIAIHPCVYENITVRLLSTSVDLPTHTGQYCSATVPCLKSNRCPLMSRTSVHMSMGRSNPPRVPRANAMMLDSIYANWQWWLRRQPPPTLGPANQTPPRTSPAANPLPSNVCCC